MEHVKDKRQAILDATLRLISQNGFHGTAVAKIAQQAVEQYIRSPYYHPGIDAELSQDYQPLHACFERARGEMIIKDFPQSVLNILTLDVATSLAQKQAGGQLALTDELIEQVIDTSWEAIRQ